jgi:hypothetical protein
MKSSCNGYLKIRELLWSRVGTNLTTAKAFGDSLVYNSYSCDPAKKRNVFAPTAIDIITHPGRLVDPNPIRPAGKIQLYLPQNLQEVLVRMPLSSRL